MLWTTCFIPMASALKKDTRSVVYHYSMLFRRDLV